MRCLVLHFLNRSRPPLVDVCSFLTGTPIDSMDGERSAFRNRPVSCVHGFCYQIHTVPLKHLRLPVVVHHQTASDSFPVLCACSRHHKIYLKNSRKHHHQVRASFVSLLERTIQKRKQSTT